jgi:hypothetical protein
MNEVGSIDFSDWFSGLEIIPLETNASSVINECFKIVYSHQRYYVHDQRQHAVFVFDSIGKFLFSTLPLKGKGPGEYVTMTDFCINQFTGNLEILDARAQTVRIYDRDRMFIKNIRLPANLLPLGQFKPLSSDLYLFYSPDYKKIKKSIRVVSLSKRKVIKEILPLPDNTDELPLVNVTPFHELNNTILFSYPFSSNDVFQIDTMSEIITHYKYDFGKYTLDLKTIPEHQDKAFYRRFDELNKNNYAFPIRKLENQLYRFCFFSYKDDLYICKSEKQSLHQEVVSNKFNNGGLILPSVFIDEKYLYHVAEPVWLSVMLTKEMLSPEQQDILSQVEKENNPVVIRYKMK